MSDSPEPKAPSDDPKVDEIDDDAGEPEAGPLLSNSVPLPTQQAPYSL